MSEQPIIPSSAIEGLLLKVFVDQSAETGLFWDALIKARLYAPLNEGAAAEKRTEPLAADERGLLLHGVDSKGGRIQWLFTSPEVLFDYTDKQLPYLDLPADAMLRLASVDDLDIVLIGPDGVTLHLHPDLVSSLSEGRVPEAPDKVKYVAKDAQVMVGPAKDAAELEVRFREILEAEEDILEACFIQVSDGAGSRLLLGLRLRHADKPHLKAIASRLAKAAEGALEKGASFDITLIDGPLKGAFEKWGKSFIKR